MVARSARNSNLHSTLAGSFACAVALSWDYTSLIYSNMQLLSSQIQIFSSALAR